MKKKSFIIILSLLGISLNSCSPTLMTNLSPVDNGRSYTRQTNSSQVNGNGKTKKTKSKDERENRSISKTSGNVVLTCLGEGSSLSDATANALRNGIEQTYGAFVSSNTTILNDKIVKDEIVSVSSGNIVAYEIKSQNRINNKWNVVIQAEISQSKLASFAKSKGASVDINTSALAMNIKLARFYKESEKKALIHLGEQLKEIVPFCLEYTIKTTEPIKTYENKKEVWIVNTWLGYKINAQNYQAAQNLIKETRRSLGMTKQEAQNIKALGEDIYGFSCDGDMLYLRTTSRDLAHEKYHFFDVDSWLWTIAPNNFVLYRNGEDITTQIPKTNAYGKSQKTIRCPDRFITNVYEAKECMSGRKEGEYLIYYERARMSGGYIQEKEFSFINRNKEHWFGVYEVVLSLNDLERFNANYQINPKVQK